MTESRLAHGKRFVPLQAEKKTSWENLDSTSEQGVLFSYSRSLACEELSNDFEIAPQKLLRQTVECAV